MDKFSVYETILNSAFKTDYHFKKRNYHGDKVKVQKIFWSTVVGNYHKYGEIDFSITIKLLIDTLYDRPSLEVFLLSDFEGKMYRDFEPSENEVRLLRTKVEEGEKIKRDLIKAIEQFVSESVVLDEPQIIDLKLRKNHHPNLPSISMVVDALRSKAANAIIDGPLYYPFQDKLSVSDVNLFRKKGDAYTPYYLYKIILDRLSALKTGQKFHVKKRVSGASSAVKDNHMFYPWEIRYPDVILEHRIINYYSDMKGEDLEPDSILKAIKRFKSEQ